MIHLSSNDGWKLHFILVQLKAAIFVLCNPQSWQPVYKKTQNPASSLGLMLAML